MSELSSATRRWTRLEDDRRVGAGVRGSGDPVELIDGRLRASEPQGPPRVGVLNPVDPAPEVDRAPAADASGAF